MFLRLIFTIYLLLVAPFSMAEELYVRGHILHFLEDPNRSANSYQYFEDGLLVIDAGKIKKVGNYHALNKTIPPQAKITHYKDGLILPGFIDTHIHYPQVDMIAANSGGHLLQWLDSYTFPFERKFKDKHYANDVANFFLDELIRNGTTPLLKRRLSYANTLADKLFVLMTLGDDRSVIATYVNGRLAYLQDKQQGVSHA